MLTQLMKAFDEHEQIIKMQEGVIDELFILVCQYTNLDIDNGLEPIINSISNIVEKKSKL